MKDKIKPGCEIAADSISVIRDCLTSVLANLRYSSRTPEYNNDYLRLNGLGSALVDIELAQKKLSTLHEFINDLREKAMEYTTHE